MKLLDLLPSYYDDIYEIRELVKSEQNSFNKFDSTMDQSLNNMFVMLANEDGISALENQYSVTVNPEDSLEQRRYNLLTKLLPPKPITVPYFKELLKILGISADVSVESSILHVDTVSDETKVNENQLDKLHDLLKTYLPTNLTYQVHIKGGASSNSNLYFGTANVTTVSTRSKVQTVFNSNATFNSRYIGSVHQTSVNAKSKVKGGQ